jgi:SMC interacting uncharacterized protein involved in chromosome segregation
MLHLFCKSCRTAKIIGGGKMIAYKVKGNEVIEVECEELRYPLKDSDGDIICNNTHFNTKKEAYQRAIRECTAGISLITREIKELRSRELELQKRLADECIDLERLKEEYERIDAN